MSQPDRGPQRPEGGPEKARAPPALRGRGAMGIGAAGDVRITLLAAHCGQGRASCSASVPQRSSGGFFPSFLFSLSSFLPLPSPLFFPSFSLFLFFSFCLLLFLSSSISLFFFPPVLLSFFFSFLSFLPPGLNTSSTRRGAGIRETERRRGKEKKKKKPFKEKSFLSAFLTVICPGTSKLTQNVISLLE